MSDSSKTIEKMLAVLDVLADGRALTVRELADELDMNRTVVQRLLATLQNRDFVARLDGDGFVLSFHLREVGNSVMPRLRGAAQPVVRELAQKTGGTVTIQVSDDADAVVVVEQVARDLSLQVRHSVGARSPLDRGAGGKAILAFSSSRSLAKSTELPADEASEIRVRGYACSANELQPGVQAIASPIRDVDGTVIAAVAVLTAGGSDADPETHVAALKRAVRDIEARLTECD